MKKALIALLLLVASVARAQTPVSVRYQTSNPSLTLNCTPGQMVWNTTNFNPFLCNAPPDGTNPRFKNMLTGVSTGFPITVTNGGLTYSLSAPTTATALQGLRQLTGPFGTDMYDYFEYDTNVGTPIYKMHLGFTPADSNAELNASQSQWTWRWLTPGSQSVTMEGTNAWWFTRIRSEINSARMDLDLGLSNQAALTTSNAAGDALAGWSFAPFAGLNNGFSLFAFTPTIASALSVDNEVGQIQLRIDNAADGTNAYYTAIPGAIELSVVSDSSPAQGTTVQINGNGVRDLNTGSKPACSITTWSYRWYTFGGPGVADTYEVCMKDALDAYAWKVLATP